MNINLSRFFEVPPMKLPEPEKYCTKPKSAGFVALASIISQERRVHTSSKGKRKKDVPTLH